MRDTTAGGDSDRSFGLVFTAFFAVVGLVPVVHGAAPRRFAGLAKDLGLEFVSLAPLCREKWAPEMYSDHFSRMGHHWVAGYLADLIPRTASVASTAAGGTTSPAR